MKAKWNFPNEIRFGQKRIAELQNACETLQIKRPLFVTDKALATMPMTQNALKSLENSAIFCDIDANPTEKNIEAGVAVLQQGEFDGVIAFGGGSALDGGKAIAFMGGQSREIWDFEDKADWWSRANSATIKPIIAVPTTAGTGSEVGRACIISNSQSKQKKIIFHPQILPKIVICDPLLTIDMPPAITAGTGLDALAHCVEAFSSPHFHPMSQGIALEGMRLVKDYLPLAYKDGQNIEARANMMAAATMGAVAFQKGLGAIHALSHPIGAMYNTHHGTTNAVFMPYVLQFNSDKIADKFSLAARYLGIENGFDGFCNFINELNDSLDIPKTLSELGIASPDIERIVKDALDDPSCQGNPIPMNEQNVRQLLEKCL